MPDEEEENNGGGWRRIVVISIAVAAAVLIVVLVVIALRAGPPVVHAAAADRRDLLVPILADGTLEPPAGGEIRSPDSGVVAEFFVHEGDRVKAGQPVLRLANPELDQKVLASRSDVAAMAPEESRAQGDLDLARRDADRLKALVDSDARLLQAGAITRQQAGGDEQQYRQTLERIRVAQAQLASLRERRRLIDSSTAELQRRAAKLIVRSPADGVIYNLPRTVGETVIIGQVIGTAVDRDHLRVRIRVDEPDLPRIRTGQAIFVTFEGIPDRRWDGRITLVPPGIREVGGRDVGEVIGMFSDATGALPPNASVNVEIIVGEKKDALVIPRAALFREGDVRYVFRLDGAKARRVDVKAGLIAPNDVEILDGLRPGDRVVIPGVVPIKDGQKVEVQSS